MNDLAKYRCHASRQHNDFPINRHEFPSASRKLSLLDRNRSQTGLESVKKTDQVARVGLRGGLGPSGRLLPAWVVTWAVLFTEPGQTRVRLASCPPISNSDPTTPTRR